MGTKHTSGEWKVSEEPFTLLVTHQITEKKVRTICQISSMSKSPEETLANAKLIACAPDMLSVLKEAVDHAHVYDTNKKLIELFEAVIKKATN